MPSTSQTISVPAVSAERVLGCPPAAVIDLRSPAEFADDHLPGAKNLPLFDDEERALIGTLYRQDSPEAAFHEGRARTREKIGELTRRIATLAGWAVPPVDLGALVADMTAGGMAKLEGGLVPERVDRLPADAVVFYCWRGGLRSRSVVAFLRELGFEHVAALEGGYKAYRAEVRRRLAAWRAPEGASFVLRGLTGVGKSLVLNEVERLRPGWTLDLEALAGHRSSILGMVGREPCSQKTFESRLLARIERGFPGSCVIEGESRKVGDIVLPGEVWRAITEGVSIELHAPLERRIEVLTEDYLEKPGNRAEIRAQLPFIEARLGSTKWNGALVALLDDGRTSELVEVLLERYYDPLYRHSEKRHTTSESIDATDPARAARDVVAWIEARSR